MNFEIPKKSISKNMIAFPIILTKKALSHIKSIATMPSKVVQSICKNPIFLFE